MQALARSGHRYESNTMCMLMSCPHEVVLILVHNFRQGEGGGGNCKFNNFVG